MKRIMYVALCAQVMGIASLANATKITIENGVNYGAAIFANVGGRDSEGRDSCGRLGLASTAVAFAPVTFGGTGALGGIMFDKMAKEEQIQWNRFEIAAPGYSSDFCAVNELKIQPADPAHCLKGLDGKFYRKVKVPGGASWWMKLVPAAWANRPLIDMF